MKTFSTLHEELIEEGLKDSFNKIKKMLSRFHAAADSMDPDSLNELIKQAEWHLNVSKRSDKYKDAEKRKLAFYVKKLKTFDAKKDKDRILIGRMQSKFLDALKNVSPV